MNAVWPSRPLGDIVNITKGRKPRHLVSDSRGGAMPYATADFFRSGTATQFVPADELANCVITQKGCPVLIWDGSNAGEVFVGKDAVLASTMALVRPDESVLEEGFCYFFLKTVFDELNDGTTGSTIPHVSKLTLAALQIPVPPLAEQQLISRLLFKLESAIAIQAQLATVTAELKRATMRELFTRGLRGEPQKDTEIGPVPESWEIVTINDIAIKTQYGLSVRGQPTGGTPILRMNCQDDGRVVFRDLQFVDLDAETLAAFRLQPGDLLFNRTNSIEHVGRTAIYEGSLEAVFASYLIRLSINVDRCLPRFLNYYLNRPEVQTDIKRLASRAVGQANINATKLRTVAFPLPRSFEEQRDIVAILDAIDRKIELHRKKKQVLEELFKALLHKLMTGEIRVADLDLSALDSSHTPHVAA